MRAVLRTISICTLSLCAFPLQSHANSAMTTPPTITAATHSALGSDPHALRVSRSRDMSMSCEALHEESLLMRDIINTTEDLKDNSKFKKRGITAIGAVGSFLIGSVTGGIGLAAAGFIASNEMEHKTENADTIQDKAEARRSLMVGLYNGKHCDGSIDYVLIDNSNSGTYNPNDSIADRLAKIETASGDENRPIKHQKSYYND